MKLSKKERARVARAFRLAKPLVESREIEFICVALTRLETLGRISSPVMLNAKEVINDRLGHHDCLESWVFQRITGKKPSSLGKREYRLFTTGSAAYEKGRDARLRWLDSLIKEFSE